jgi:hypothetical protein
MTAAQALRWVMGRERRRPMSRAWRWLAAIGTVLLVVYVGLSIYGNRFMRTRMESALNAQLKGYTVAVPRLELNLFGFSITLRDVTITQEAHPKPAVANLAALHAGVDWRALLHRSLVAHFRFDEPVLHIDLNHLRAEVKDKTKFTDRGWQDAAYEIYPLEINRFEVRGGQVTYIDEDPKRPLKLKALNILLENIRNVRSPDNVYPSTLQASAQVFGRGRVELSGQADFLAKPFMGVNADIQLRRIPLEELKPVAAHANLQLSHGVLDAEGHVEYAPRVRDVRLERAVIDGLHVDYVHTAATESKEKAQAERVTEVARDVSNEPATSVRVDDVHLTNARLAYADRERGYRVFIDDADVRLRGVTSQAEPPPATLMAQGTFMGVGRAALSSQFRPVNKKPEFTLTLQIEETPLPVMNDLFRAYGNFDIAKGTFAFYSELEARGGRIDGYVKPVFADMEVYAVRQDADKPILNQVYEGLVGTITGLLRNPSTDVATTADVSGRVDDPNVSTLQIIIRLIQNAFFGSILPGLENEARKKLEG